MVPTDSVSGLCPILLPISKYEKIAKSVLIWCYQTVLKAVAPTGPPPVTFSNWQPLTASHTLLFPLYQETFSPLLSSILIPVLPADIPVPPTSAPRAYPTYYSSTVLYFTMSFGNN